MSSSDENSSARLRDHLLEGIQSGRWRAGDPLPSERELVTAFGLSRAAVRESLSELGGLGVIDRGQGRRAVVRPIDSSTFTKLFPVMLAHDGAKTHRDVFEVRIALESTAAATAALRRTDEEAHRIALAAEAYGAQIEQEADTPAVDLDFAFHRAVAEATHNPLFPTLLEAISGFVLYAQQASGHQGHSALVDAHENHIAIARAIRDRDPDRARLEMSYHLHRSAEQLEFGD